MLFTLLCVCACLTSGCVHDTLSHSTHTRTHLHTHTHTFAHIYTHTFTNTHSLTACNNMHESSRWLVSCVAVCLLCVVVDNTYSQPWLHVRCQPWSMFTLICFVVGCVVLFDMFRVQSLASTPKPSRSFEKSYTEKVTPTFAHQVSHELSPEELELVRRLVTLTSSTPDDTPGTYENKLYAQDASGEAIAVAEEIMAATSYAFNFVLHGQHESGNIREVIDQHSDSKVPRSETTKLQFDDGRPKVGCVGLHWVGLSWAVNDWLVAD